MTEILYALLSFNQSLFILIADGKGIQKSTCLLLVKSKKHLWTLLVKFCPTNDELEPD